MRKNAMGHLIEELDADPGSFDRIHPICLGELEKDQTSFLNGTPTPEECERLRESVRNGSYGHYVDILILAVLEASEARAISG